VFLKKVNPFTEVLVHNLHNFLVRQTNSHHIPVAKFGLRVETVSFTIYSVSNQDHHSSQVSNHCSANTENFTHFDTLCLIALT
jgi:hypothetical protein